MTVRLMDSWEIIKPREMIQETLKENQDRISQAYPNARIIGWWDWELPMQISKRKAVFYDGDTATTLIAEIDALARKFWMPNDYFHPALITIPIGIKVTSSSDPMAAWSAIFNVRVARSQLIMILEDRTRINLTERSYTLIFSESVAKEFELDIDEFFWHDSYQQSLPKLILKANTIVLHGSSSPFSILKEQVVQKNCFELMRRFGSSTL